MSSNDQTSGASLYIRALICNAAAGASAGNLPFFFFLLRTLSYFGFSFNGYLSIS